MTPPAIAKFLARQYGTAMADLGVTVSPVQAGLECQVIRVRIVTRDRRVPARLVVKQLSGTHRREAAVYAAVQAAPEPAPTARLHGVEERGGASYLYLEDLQPPVEWPWADTSLAVEVCRALAAVHRSQLTLQRDEWNYERELAQSAESTIALARQVCDARGVRLWRRRGDLVRVIDYLPMIRRHLSQAGQVLIHGDLHPGNVIVVAAAAGARIRFIDWARARYGSPFEDVASWLHSLGCWEPEARRRHDTLLGEYLRALWPGRQICRQTRTIYWLAAACNGLSGAIRYHLAVAGDPSSLEPARSASRAAVREWERVIRLAASLLPAAAQPRSARAASRA